MRTKVFTQNEKKLLIICIVVPFIVINGFLYTVFNGVHGELKVGTNSPMELNGTVDGERVHGDRFPSEGRFKGDLYVAGNTGWLICNGKIRFFGPVHIRNTDLHYQKHEAGPGYYDPGEVILDGTEGEMKEGFPLYYVGAYASLLATICWAMAVFIRRVEKGYKMIPPTLLFSLLFLSSLPFSSPKHWRLHGPAVCCSVLYAMILIPFTLTSLLVKMDKLSYRPERLWYSKATIIIGTIILAISFIFIFDPFTPDSWSWAGAITDMRQGMNLLFITPIIFGSGIGGIIRKRDKLHS